MMSQVPQVSPEAFGNELARLRRRRGLSQQRLAELLCAAAGVSTVSRHEVSRWERGQRVPGRPWLGWLASVLGSPLPDPVREHRAQPGAATISACEQRRWAFLRLQLGRSGEDDARVLGDHARTHA